MRTLENIMLVRLEAQFNQNFSSITEAIVAYKSFINQTKNKIQFNWKEIGEHLEMSPKQARNTFEQLQYHHLTPFS